MTLDAPKISLIFLSVAVVFLLQYHYSAVELRHMNVHGTALHGIACIKKDHVLSMHHIYSFCMRQSWYVTCLAFLLLDFGPVAGGHLRDWVRAQKDGAHVFSDRSSF